MDARRRQRAGRGRGDWRCRSPSRGRQGMKTKRGESERRERGKKQRGEGLSTSQARAGLPPQAGVRHNPEPRRYEAEIPPTLPPSSNSFLFLKEMLNFQKKRSSNSVRDRPFGCLC